MNRQEILNVINKTKEHLANMEKMLEKCEYERWKPADDDKYYYVSEKGTVIEIRAWAECITNGHYDFYNCFRTKQEAEQEAEKILVRRQLEDIARRLNEGRKIDWSNEDQKKYYIWFNYYLNKIDIDNTFGQQVLSTVYCLNENYLDVVIQEIGEERLKKYLRGE